MCRHVGLPSLAVIRSETLAFSVIEPWVFVIRHGRPDILFAAPPSAAYVFLVFRANVKTER